jgi:pyridoxamine 5'-phosphate oxidase family protein
MSNNSGSSVTSCTALCAGKNRPPTWPGFRSARRRLATVQPDGTLQNNPVGYRYNPSTGTIDIAGYNMAASRKLRNVADNGRVAFVVDGIVSTQPWRVRCLEICGFGEAIDPATDPTALADVAIIRIHPRRIISFGLDNSEIDPHLLVPSKRNVT